MRQYLQLLAECLAEGARQKNRTGIDTFMIPGARLVFNLADGFPILTTKLVNFKAVAAELIGFLRGVDSAKDFRELGTKIWDANANGNRSWRENPNRKGLDDLGRIYGVQWRQWSSFLSAGQSLVWYDQIAILLNNIEKDPTSRRLIVTAWRPDELDQMALPPCHLLFQVLIEQETRRMHMCMYQRSCDMFLGVPFNISSYALLLSILAKATGYLPGLLTMFLADVHVYENHRAQVAEQLTRKEKALPRLVFGADLPAPSSMGGALKWIERLSPLDFALEGYDPHPAIKAEMAV